jgi:Cysteine sulfinate desulfinase/cysteine desulfurase and related enzymes
VATIVAMGAAAKLANEQLEENLNRFSTYSALLRKLLVQKIPSIIFNGPKSSSAQVPNTVSICVPGIRAEALAALLDSLNGIQVSLGSACSNNKTMSLSHVLLSMGLSEEDVKSTLRVSLGLYTREEDILSFAEAVANAVGILNRISRPVSEDYVFAS